MHDNDNNNNTFKAVVIVETCDIFLPFFNLLID